MAAGIVWYITFIVLPRSQIEETTIRNGLKISQKNGRNYQKVVTGNNKRRMGRRTYVILVSISFIGIVITYSLYPPLYSQFAGANTLVIPVPNNSKHPVTLGALLSINGASSSVGESEEAGLKLAVRDVNDYFSKTNSDIRIGLVVEDTHTDPRVITTPIESTKFCIFCCLYYADSRIFLIARNLTELLYKELLKL